jgi:hypothetical protein
MLNIYRSEASASLRRIPMWLVGSNGTTPATGEAGGQPQINWIPRGAATVNTGATLSLVSANAGEYFVELTASEVSALGVAALHYRSANAIPNSTYFQIVNYDSGDSVRLGLFALPNAAAEASGGLITLGTGAGQLHVSSGSVGLKAQTHSDVTIHSVTRVNSSVTIANAEYSAVTVRLGLVSYSGATVGAGNIAPASYSGVTVEVSNIAQSARSLIADDFLLRDLATGQPGTGGRSVQNALRPLRNRVAIGGSTITVFSEDDSTSAWTGSITTTTDSPIASINPLGGSA